MPELATAAFAAEQGEAERTPPPLHCLARAGTPASAHPLLSPHCISPPPAWELGYIYLSILLLALCVVRVVRTSWLVWAGYHFFCIQLCVSGATRIYVCTHRYSTGWGSTLHFIPVPLQIGSVKELTICKNTPCGVPLSCDWYPDGTTSLVGRSAYLRADFLQVVSPPFCIRESLPTKPVRVAGL